MTADVIEFTQHPDVKDLLHEALDENADFALVFLRTKDNAGETMYKVLGTAGKNLPELVGALEIAKYDLIERC